MVRSLDQQIPIKKALSAKAIEKMKIGDPDRGDIWEYVGLRVHCGKTLILSRWNSIFTNIPVESLIYQNQKTYYEALQMSTDRTDSAPLIAFILQMNLDTILSSTERSCYRSS